MRIRHIMTTATAVLAISAVTAGPALAHYCYKTGWTEAAQAGASGSQAWATTEEMRDFVAFAVDAGFVCEAGGDAAYAYLDDLPSDTLFLGPGLLAGGAKQQGRGPAHIEHLPLHEFEELCES